MANCAYRPRLRVKSYPNEMSLNSTLQVGSISSRVYSRGFQISKSGNVLKTILFPKVFERKIGNTAVCNMLCNHRVCQDALGFGEAVLQSTSGRTSYNIYILVIWLQNVEYMLYLCVLLICLFTVSSHSSNFHPNPICSMYGI